MDNNYLDKSKNWEKWLFYAAIVAYTVTAIFSSGYYHADEHFQLLEFAEYKLGGTTSDNLPWEFHTQMRPTLQVGIAYVVLTACRELGLENPWYQAMVLRLLTAALALFAIRLFTRSCRSYFTSPAYWRLFLSVSWFLWFVPWINVRFSAETWSGLWSLLFVGLLIRYKEEKGNYFVLGALAGIAFLLKFQAALMIGGAGLWWLIYSRPSFVSVGKMLLAFTVMLGIGVLIDSWFYGQWCFSPYAYLNINVFHSVASIFGETPWYGYIKSILVYPYIPFGILILLSSLYGSIRHYKSFFLWVVMPYFIVHTILPHKEFRFLFPLINFIPFMLVVSLQDLQGVWGIKSVKPAAWVIGGSLVIVNMFGLMVSAFKPAGDGRVSLTKKVNEIAHNEPVLLLTKWGDNPYNPYLGKNPADTLVEQNPFHHGGEVKAVFYRHYGLDYEERIFYSIDSVSTLLDPRKTTLLAMKIRDFQEPETKELLKNVGFEAVAYSGPQGIDWIYDVYARFKQDKVFVLLRRSSDQR